MWDCAGSPGLALNWSGFGRVMIISTSSCALLVLQLAALNDFMTADRYRVLSCLRYDPLVIYPSLPDFQAQFLIWFWNNYLR
jgi:hypothetical protein